MRLTNTFISILNSITALLSLALIGVGIWLAIKHNNPSSCLHLLQWPAIILGAFVLLVSLAGLLGSSCRSPCLLFVYLFVLFLLILFLVAVTVFGFVITHKGAGQVVSGKGFEEYHLGDYSTWLQRNVDKAGNWKKIKSCLVDGKVCSSLQKNNLQVTQFYENYLSPIQSGCCKPPTACNFTYVNPTSWKNATNKKADPDCIKWKDDSSELCFDCDSCRAGVLQTAKEDWKKVAIASIVVLVFLIIVFVLGCCAFTNSRRRHSLPVHYVKA